MGRAAAFVQVVDILRHQRQFVLFCQFCQGEMRGIGLRFGCGLAPFVVEAVHKGRVALIGFGCGDILDPVVFPQAVGGAEGPQAAFG